MRMSVCTMYEEVTAFSITDDDGVSDVNPSDITISVLSRQT